MKLQQVAKNTSFISLPSTVIIIVLAFLHVQLLSTYVLALLGTNIAMSLAVKWLNQVKQILPEKNIDNTYLKNTLTVTFSMSFLCLSCYIFSPLILAKFSFLSSFVALHYYIPHIFLGVVVILDAALRSLSVSSAEKSGTEERELEKLKAVPQTLNRKLQKFETELSQIQSNLAALPHQDTSEQFQTELTKLENLISYIQIVWKTDSKLLTLPLDDIYQALAVGTKPTEYFDHDTIEKHQEEIVAILERKINNDTAHPLISLSDQKQCNNALAFFKENQCKSDLQATFLELYNRILQEKINSAGDGSIKVTLQELKELNLELRSNFLDEQGTQNDILQEVLSTVASPDGP